MTDQLNPQGIRTAGIKLIPVVSGKYKVWTKRIGKGGLKVLVLHGGPGFPHDYMESFEDFLPEAGMEMYYYDQLGCGNSDKPDDTSLWNLERYLVEVEEVREGLGLTDFALVGHSWGGMLALEYAFKHQNDRRLRGVVISNMTASIDTFLVGATKWKKTLPAELLRRVEELEAAEDWENPEYEKILMDLYSQMICRTQPWPESVDRAFRKVNNTIYHQMQGHSEFSCTGNMKGWDAWSRLPEITLNTLVLGAENDEMLPEYIHKMADAMPNAKAEICPKGSHFSMWDDQEIYFQHLLGFLRSL